MKVFCIWLGKGNNDVLFELKIEKIIKIRPLGNTFKYSGDINL